MAIMLADPYAPCADISERFGCRGALLEQTVNRHYLVWSLYCRLGVRL
jgi:hypothetical protein